MGMSSGGSKGGATPNINVTPLIDVLLVLLIIFMIIAPLKPARFEAKVPAEPKDNQNRDITPNPLTLVVTINNTDKKVILNKDDAGNVDDASALTTRLAQIFKDRENNGVFREGTNEVEKTVFIKAPKNINYGSVVKVVDAVKQAGAEPVGLQIDELSSE
ncbi:MAG TPA: biopolymer transporter ExbD [Pyrinomonadaceae bacterium]|nr:biopolymer transporter ExbD [Pyrinomonadaceae bacterium]